MPRFVATTANRRGSSGVELRAMGGAVLFALFLPGCPLSDNYYVDAAGGLTAANGGQTTVGGTSGAGLSGNPALGGGPSAGAVGGAGRTTLGGSSGTTASGGGTGGTAGSAGCVTEAERCDGIDNDCDDEIDEDAVCPDGCSVRINDKHRYLLCIAASKANGVTTDDAAARCNDLALELGASFHLTSIESQKENDFLRTWLEDSLSGAAVVWMGANDRTKENTWVWGFDPDGEQFYVGDSGGGGTPYMNRFNDWSPGSPRSLNGEDQDCGSFDTGLDLHWDDRSCQSVELGFICEERVPASP